MIIFGDYHTHTPYSHGKGTILENALVAKAKGLKEIAITDHSFNHKLYGAKRSDISLMRAECDEAEKITGVKVLLGVEANFISNDGTIDVSPEDYEKLDIVLCGQHNFVKAKTIKDTFSLFVRNIISAVIPVSKKKIEKNTQTCINAIKKNKIDVLTHLNYGMKVNTLEVAKFARDNNVYVEINGKQIHFTDEEIKQMVAEKVKFIINSDAHTAKRVGEVNGPINFAVKHNIPQQLIVNVNKIPTFNKTRK